MAAAAFTAAPAAVFSGSRLLTSTSTPAPPRLNPLLPRRPSPLTLAAADSHRSSGFLVRASSEETSSSIQTDELLADLKEKWDGLENKSAVFIYGGGAVVAVWLSSIVVGAINSVPLLPKIMELVGLGYTGWFVYRYLLFKASRKELAADIETLKKKIAGTGE